MKKTFKKVLGLIMAVILTLSMSTSVLAERGNTTRLIERNPIEKENLSEHIFLEHGEMHLEETDFYRIVYFIPNDIEEAVSYSICYKDTPGVAHVGTLALFEQEVFASDNKDITSNILSRTAEKVIDFISRAQVQSNTVHTAQDALNYVSAYGPDWRTPVNSRLIGQYRPGNITVNLYESIEGRCTESNLLAYYIDDPLGAIISVLGGISLSDILSVVTYLYRVGTGYVAKANGTLTYFKIDNTRTKAARINGGVYYWAGWDMIYKVFSGDKGTEIKKVRDYAHPDYNENINYFGAKAIENYNNYN